MTPRGATQRLSIIIPALNEETGITGLLQDLAPLRRQGHEIIVVDGGSGDLTREAAAPWVDRVQLSAPGRAVQMNVGARSATGDLFWFLHADTRVPADAAAALLDAATRGRAWGRFDVSLSGPGLLLGLVARLMNLRSRITGLATGDQGIFVDRSAFESIGGFPQIPLMEDIALCKALRRHAAPACIRRPRLLTSSRRWEQHGVIRTILLMWRLRLAYALGAPPHELAKRYR